MDTVTRAAFSFLWDLARIVQEAAFFPLAVFYLHLDADRSFPHGFAQWALTESFTAGYS